MSMDFPCHPDIVAFLGGQGAQVRLRGSRACTPGHSLGLHEPGSLEGSDRAYAVGAGGEGGRKGQGEARRGHCPSEYRSPAGGNFHRPYV